MHAVEEYYVIMAFQEMAKKRSDFISKIRSMSAVLKPRRYEVMHVMDNNGTKQILRIPTPDAKQPEITEAEGQYLEAVAVVEFWITKLNLKQDLQKYKEFKEFCVDGTPHWETLAVTKMITKLKEHFESNPLNK